MNPRSGPRSTRPQAGSLPHQEKLCSWHVDAAGTGATAYTNVVPRRLRSALTAFGFFTAIGLLLFAYRYLDYAARNHPIPVLVPLIEELTGAWMAALPYPLLVRFARRYSNLRRTWPLHLLAMALFSAVHTSLMWLTRSLLFPAFGLGPYDYGIMSFRFPMEFFNDVIVYWVIVSMLYLFDHRVRSAQLEGKLAYRPPAEPPPPATAALPVQCAEYHLLCDV